MSPKQSDRGVQSDVCDVSRLTLRKSFHSTVFDLHTWGLNLSVNFTVKAYRFQMFLITDKAPTVTYQRYRRLTAAVLPPTDNGYAATFLRAYPPNVPIQATDNIFIVSFIT